MAALIEGPVAVVGLGAIGGSLARALVVQDVAVRGVEPNVPDRTLARSAGIEVVDDAAGGLPAAVAGARLVVLAVPIPALSRVAAECLAYAGAETVVVHTASLQRPEALGFDAVLRAQVFGTHPIAGTQRSGFAAARPDLFWSATVSIDESAPERVRRAAETLWRGVGAERVEFRSAEAHDRLMSWISHLPQLAATALAVTLGEAGIAPAAAGPGARDTTRLAGSSLDVWRGILEAAPPDTVDALAALERAVGALRAALAARDVARAEELWTRGRAWRRAVEALS